jgi:hypothetical protein
MATATGSSSPVRLATRRRTKSSAHWRPPSIRSSARRPITRERTRNASPPQPRAANPAASLHVAASIEEAVRVSQELAKAKRRRIYVAGGLFLAIEYATVAKGDRAEDLKFF